MRLKARLRENIALVQAMSAFLVRILASLIAYGFQVYLARSLGIEDYGIFVALWGWQVILTHLAVMGFSENAVRFIPRYSALGRADLVSGFLSKGFWSVVLGGLGLSVICLAGLWFFGDLVSGSRYGAILVIAIGMPVLALDLYIEGVSRGLGWYMFGTIPAYILRPLLTLVGLFLLSYSGVVLTAAVALGVMVAVTALLISMQAACIHRQVKVAGKAVDQRYRRKRNRYWMVTALPLLIVTGVDELLYWSDVVVLSIMVPPEGVSVYFAALRIMAIAALIHYGFMFVFAREFSLAKGGDGQVLQERVSMASTWTFWLTLPAVGIMAALGPWFMQLFGKDFDTDLGMQVMLAIGIGLIGKAAVGSASNLLIVSGKERANVTISLICLVGNIALSVALIPVIGVVGAAVGTAASQILRSILLAGYISKTLGISVMARFEVPRIQPSEA